MQNNSLDNIVAISTANGHSGIGIVRISGSNLLPIIANLTHLSEHQIQPRYAHYTQFKNQDNVIIDSGIVIFFKSPNSFTGEDVVEIHGHGSPITLNMLMKRLVELGCRVAKPGEFSHRAYLNGKLDLVQAESIIDLINAESESAAIGALKSMYGTFSKYIDGINKGLINLRMFVEASLDFPEEDLEFIANAKIKEKLTILLEQINKLLDNTKQGVLLNNGANIVIIGRPNVGKSSLLNALANEEVAIVTDIAGTTRDIIRERILINGIRFNLIDTAGIRKTEDTIEQIGIKRALLATTNAALCLVLIDNTTGITEQDLLILDQIPANLKRLYVHNKIDLDSIAPQVKNIEGQLHVYISAKELLGIDLVRDNILNLVGFDNNNSDIFIARERHLSLINKAVNHVKCAFNNWHNLELLAEELRYAHNCLGEITGEFSSDDLLGTIFKEFCIGK